MDINFVESFSSIFLFPLLVYKSRIRQIRSWRTYCYVVNVDIIAFPQTELYIFYSEKLLWFVLDVRILYCSLVSPGFSLGVNLPLAEPFQCVEGFSHLLEATVLIKILLILWTDRSTTYILGTSKIQNVKAVHKSFSFSPLSLLPLPNGPASTFLFRLSLWAPLFPHVGTSPEDVVVYLCFASLKALPSGVSVWVYEESQGKRATSFCSANFP